MWAIFGSSVLRLAPSGQWFIYSYVYEDISIRGITEAKIYFEQRHQFESTLLLKIVWSFRINHFEVLFLILWLPQHIITYCYREFAKIPICSILYYMIEIRNYVSFTSLCIKVLYLSSICNLKKISCSKVFLNMCEHKFMSLRNAKNN